MLYQIELHSTHNDCVQDVSYSQFNRANACNQVSKTIAVNAIIQNQPTDKLLANRFVKKLWLEKSLPDKRERSTWLINKNDMKSDLAAFVTTVMTSAP